MRLYSHDDGASCDLLNGLDVTCESLAAANIYRFLTERAADDRLLRMAYSSYKVSTAIRFGYLKALTEFPASRFEEGFAPVRLALLSEDDFATDGLYLIELYFGFCGLTERLVSVNQEVADSLLYQFLSHIGIDRKTVRESAATRSYARMLSAEYGQYKNAFSLSGVISPGNCPL